MKSKGFAWAVTALLVVAILGTGGTVDTTPEIGSNTDRTCGQSLARDDGDSSLGRELPVLRISIAPKERRVTRGDSDIFLVCIANPPKYNQTVSGVMTIIRHNGVTEDNMSAVGPSLTIPTKNHVGLQPIDTPWTVGEGHGFAVKSIEPGEVVQYTIVVSDLPQTGERNLITEVDYHYSVAGERKNHTVKRMAQLNVVCPPSCALSAGVSVVKEILWKHPELLLLIVGTVFTILGVLIALIGPQKVRKMLWARIGKSSQRERESREGPEEVE